MGASTRACGQLCCAASNAVRVLPLLDGPTRSTSRPGCRAVRSRSSRCSGSVAHTGRGVRSCPCPRTRWGSLPAGKGPTLPAAAVRRRQLAPLALPTAPLPAHLERQAVRSGKCSHCRILALSRRSARIRSRSTHCLLGGGDAPRPRRWRCCGRTSARRIARPRVRVPSRPGAERLGLGISDWAWADQRLAHQQMTGFPFISLVNRAVKLTSVTGPLIRVALKQRKADTGTVLKDPAWL